MLAQKNARIRYTLNILFVSKKKRVVGSFCCLIHLCKKCIHISFNDHSFNLDLKTKTKMKSINCNKCGREFSHTSSMFWHLKTAHDVSEHSCTKCGMRFKRKDNFLRHVRRQHPMTHVVTTDTENINSAKDSENTVENSKSLQETDHSGGGFTTSETRDCVTEEETINGNLKVYNLPR